MTDLPGRRLGAAGCTRRDVLSGEDVIPGFHCEVRSLFPLVPRRKSVRWDRSEVNGPGIED